MKSQLQLVFLLSMSMLAFNAGFSQNQKQDIRQPLPLVKYQSNVDAPLTARELSQIMEVYGDYAEQEILSRPQRVKDIKHLLRNRIEIKQMPDAKPCPALSEVSLFDAYVPDLKRDFEFNPHDFNPLKYNFVFFSRAAAMYKVDNTNYYIIIKSQHQ